MYTTNIILEDSKGPTQSKLYGDGDDDGIVNFLERFKIDRLTGCYVHRHCDWLNHIVLVNI